MLRVSDGPREIQAAVIALRRVERPIARAINQESRRTMAPVFVAAVDKRATRKRDRAILARGVRIAAGNPPSFKAAQSRRPLSGGLIPAEGWSGVEFGANREAFTTYQRRSPAGVTHTVTRRTKRQLAPVNKRGWVVHPAIAETAPRLVSLWVQTIVRIVHEAAEGKAV